MASMEAGDNFGSTFRSMFANRFRNDYIKDFRDHYSNQAIYNVDMVFQQNTKLLLLFGSSRMWCLMMWWLIMIGFTLSYAYSLPNMGSQNYYYQAPHLKHHIPELSNCAFLCMALGGPPGAPAAHRERLGLGPFYYFRLCYIMIYYMIWYDIISYYIMLCYDILIVHYIVLYIKYYNTCYCIILYHVMLYYIILYHKASPSSRLPFWSCTSS